MLFIVIAGIIVSVTMYCFMIQILGHDCLFVCCNGSALF